MKNLVIICLGIIIGVIAVVIAAASYIANNPVFGN